MTVAIEKQNDGTYIAYNKDCDKFTAIGSGDTIAEAKEDFFNSEMAILDSASEKIWRTKQPLTEEELFLITEKYPGSP